MKRRMLPLMTMVVALVCAVCLCGCSSGPYQPAKKDQTIDDAALVTPGTLTVGVNASSAPYAAESQGEIVGIDVDIAAALADQMGLKLKVIDAGTNTEKALTSKEADVILGVEADKANFWTSSPYMQSAVVLFSADPAAPVPTKRGTFKIAAQSSSMSAWQAGQHFGEKHLVECLDPKEAFDSLQAGSVDYVALDSTIGAYAANSMGVQAYPVALLGDISSYKVQVPGTSKGLQEAVTSALDMIKQGGTLNAIKAKWLGEDIDLEKLPKTSSTKSLKSASDKDSADEDADDDGSDADDSGEDDSDEDDSDEE